MLVASVKAVPNAPIAVANAIAPAAINDGISPQNGGCNRVSIANIRRNRHDLTNIPHRFAAHGFLWPATGNPYPNTLLRQGSDNITATKSAVTEEILP